MLYFSQVIFSGESPTSKFTDSFTVTLSPKTLIFISSNKLTTLLQALLS